MTHIDIFGFLAGLISTIAFFPQALKVWRTKSTKGISLGMYILYSLGLVLWDVYAYLIDSYHLLATEIITGTMTFYILMMKMKEYEEKE